jgi:hypothetical protein
VVAAPVLATPAVAPLHVYQPVIVLGADPVEVATRRPWQVTFFGWWQVIGLVLIGVSEAIWWVWFLSIDSWSQAPSSSTTYSDYGYETTTVSGWDLTGYHDYLLAVSIAVLVFWAIDLWIAISYLRGARGAYLYYTVIGIIRISVVVLIPVAFVVLYFVGFAALFAYA